MRATHECIHVCMDELVECDVVGCLHVSVDVRMQWVHVCHACVCVCVCVCVLVLVFMSVARLCLYVCMSDVVRVCVYICLCVRICVCIM